MKKNFKFILATIILIIFFAQSVLDDGQNIENNDNEILEIANINYQFEDEDSFTSHYQKHQDEFDSISKSEYLELANMVIENENSLMKIEDDGDSIYYLESENYLVILGTNGYIRTFFRPSDGLAYFKRT